MRRGGLGEPAQEGEARHHRQGCHVNAAGAGGNRPFLSGEVCPGVGCAGFVAAPTARAGRRGVTGQKSAEVVVPAGIARAGKDRTSGETEESVLLVPVAVIAAVPRTRASCGGRR
jgi:hypothetical protein